jgi:adenine phosphoribosyltransferase
VSEELDRLITGLVRDIPDFPKPGVMFKDITPLLDDPEAFGRVVQALADEGRRDGEVVVDKIVGIEARGFILAAPVALALGVGFIPMRKPGKLPAATLEVSYDLEYGSETLQIHADAVAPGDRVLIVDDVLATGGTAVAARTLVERAGGEVAGLAVLMELGFLDGRTRCGAMPVSTLHLV